MIKLFLLVFLLSPTPVFAQFNFVNRCVKFSKTFVAGYTDRYGNWYNGYYKVEPIYYQCQYSPVPGYTPGYTPIILPGRYY